MVGTWYACCSNEIYVLRVSLAVYYPFPSPPLCLLSKLTPAYDDVPFVPFDFNSSLSTFYIASNCSTAMLLRPWRCKPRTT